jgi:hypothetical protein
MKSWKNLMPTWTPASAGKPMLCMSWRRSGNLFEHLRTTQKYPVLALYTNWALHTRIDREPWVRAGLRMLEEIVSGFQSGSRGSEEVLKGVTGLLSFEQLHRQLLEFGAEQGIRLDALSNEQWRRFSSLLVDILIDCPLVSELKMPVVRALSLSRDFVFSNAGGQTLAFWKIDLGDGKVMAGPIF